MRWNMAHKSASPGPVATIASSMQSSGGQSQLAVGAGDQMLIYKLSAETPQAGAKPSSSQSTAIKVESTVGREFSSLYGLCFLF